MTLLLDLCQGRKQAEVPWAVEALDSLPKKRERRKGKRAGWSLPPPGFCLLLY